MSAAVAAHAERHSKGNAYNFVADAEHAASFDLVTNQLKEGELEGGGTMCFRGAADEALGCVEGAFNWFASVCVLGEHLAGISEVLLNALAQYTSGWPVGGRFQERCAAQRHFLGYAYGPGIAADYNLHNAYFLRQLMGWCLFHGCEQGATPFHDADLVAFGTAPLAPKDGGAAPAADDDPDCAAPAGESEARVPDGAPEAWLFAPGAGPGVTEFGSYDERIAAAKALPPCEEGEEDDDVECIEGEEPDPPGTPDPDPGRYARQLGEWAKETHKAGLGRWKGVPDEGEGRDAARGKGPRAIRSAASKVG